LKSVHLVGLAHTLAKQWVIVLKCHKTWADVRPRRKLQLKSTEAVTHAHYEALIAAKRNSVSGPEHNGVLSSFLRRTTLGHKIKKTYGEAVRVQLRRCQTTKFKKKTIKLSRSNNDLTQTVLCAWNQLSRYHSTFKLREV
jgi:hypothetical protein